MFKFRYYYEQIDDERTDKRTCFKIKIKGDNNNQTTVFDCRSLRTTLHDLPIVIYAEHFSNWQ